MYGCVFIILQYKTVGLGLLSLGFEVALITVRKQS